MTRQSLTALAITAIFTAACGGSSPAPSSEAAPAAGQTVVVATVPAETSVMPGKTVKFSAQVTGSSDTTVKWSVDEADGGTIDASGLYTAPAVEGTFHVTAEQASQVTATASPTTSAAKKIAGKSVVHVSKVTAAQGVVVSVTPGAATVLPGGSATFAAAVTGTANQAVNWSIQEVSSCGSVSDAGVYSAPNAAATCTVVATSAADTTKNASATVNVTPPLPHAVRVAPTAASVVTGGTITFTATVSGTTTGESTAVTWSVPAGAGSIGATTGVYVAPATPGTYMVTATSVATPPGTTTATVTVTNEPVIAVSVSPTTASIQAGGTVTFSATVTGTTAGQSSAVTWSVPAGSGTINPSTGIYVAPAAAGTYVITATSVADGTKKATASVAVVAPPVTIAISPAVATLDACKGQVFTATVTNSSNATVTWSVVEAGGGTVTNGGAYVAPTGAGTYHVLAASQADPTKTAQATITVGPEKVLSVAVTPGSGTVNASGMLTFAASVTTTCGTFAAQ